METLSALLVQGAGNLPVTDGYSHKGSVKRPFDDFIVVIMSKLITNSPVIDNLI